jgi:CO/xanthine dehydrogenase Mo-binding subunit
MTALPGILADNRQLDRWVSFASPGKVAVSTGRVELGQGVLTSVAQIAAEELDVALARVVVQSGDTELTPNEGYTAGSQSMQSGGVALRQACAEVRWLMLAHVAGVLGCAAAELTVRDGQVLRNGAPTGHDYWSLAGSLSLAVDATGNAPRKDASGYSVIGQAAQRIDLPAKVFGAPAFIHDLMLDGMRHARVVRQPNRGATLAVVDEAAIRRAAKGEIDFVRDSSFLAIVGDDESAVEAAAAVAVGHVTWQGVEPPSPLQQEAAWLLQQPSLDRVIGAPQPDGAPRGQYVEATYTRPYLIHASMGPSCGLAVFSGGHLSVWTHCQGVYPLRGALARAFKLDPSTISVKHIQGPGCYGHNGADDAAADAAAIAMRLPGRPIRVRWRREEEFAHEPVSPSMVVKVRATVDEAGTPTDWTTEIWSGNHNGRPGSGARLLVSDALADPPPLPPPADVPEANGGGGTRNGEPLYDFAAKRIIHHLIPETPRRTSSLRGLGAMPNVFALECFVDELAERAGEDPVQYRLKHLGDARARRVIERTAAMAGWTPGQAGGNNRGRGFAFARYKNTAGYAAVVVDLEVEESIRLLHAWCAADCGLAVNPDAVINQIEGGMIQSASWVLKEQVRFDNETAGPIDWESYPVLRFSEVPEIEIELLPSGSDVPLGVGEVTAGPMAAAIGNAVSHALGVRIRDLPLTRERIVATLLAM